MTISVGLVSLDHPDVVPRHARLLREFFLREATAKSATVRVAALDRLAGYGNAARPAVPIISDRLQDDNADVKRAALKTLVAIGPTASDAIPAIIKYLNTAPRLPSWWGCNRWANSVRMP